MSVETAIFTQLDSDTALAALVSSRIFPDEADPDESLPLVVYSVPSAEYTRALSGAVLLTRSTVIVEVFADTKESAAAVGDAVRSRLDGVAFAGVMRAYLGDRSTNPTDGGFSEVLTFGVVH